MKKSKEYLKGNQGANRDKWKLTLPAVARYGQSIGLVPLDDTIIVVAPPTIQCNSGLSLIDPNWVANAFLLVFAGSWLALQRRPW